MLNEVRIFNVREGIRALFFIHSFFFDNDDEEMKESMEGIL
jgi:hypothetical protein